MFVQKILWQGISIPAPTKGATPTNRVPVIVPPISIPAPTKGATLPPIPVNTDQEDFNPRTHEGCDLYDSNFIIPR